MLEGLLPLAKDLIAIPSITPQDGGCQILLQKRLESMGFEVTAIPHKGAANLWAQYGKAKPLMVFAGHTDVVPTGPEKQWDRPPFQPLLDKGYLYGRGAADMKGSLAAMIIACESFLNQKPRLQGSIGFLMTSAEEGPSDWGTPQVLHYLAQNKIPMDYCVVGEPTSEQQLGDTIKIGRRGSLTGKLTIKGKQGHIAYPHKANNPLPRTFTLLHTLCNTEWDKGNAHFAPTSFQISNLHAGTGAGNVIPGEVDIVFNFRFSPERTALDLQAEVEQRLQQAAVDFHIEWIVYAEPFFTEPGTLSQACTEIIETHCGITPQLSTSGGTSDARYIAKYTSAEVIELGPTNATIHQVNECVSVKELEQLTIIYKGLLERLLTAC